MAKLKQREMIAIRKLVSDLETRYEKWRVNLIRLGEEIETWKSIIADSIVEEDDNA